MSSNSEKNSTLPVAPKIKKYPFWTGGAAASVAAALTHPMDVAKVRLQVTKSHGLISTLVETYRQDGITHGLFGGLTASLLRQVSYSTVRFGTYDYFRTNVLPPPGPDAKTPLIYLIGASSVAGILGGISGNGADIVLVRMIKDQVLPADQKFGYRNGVDGLYQIIRKEGFLELFRGVVPNASRAALMNTGQLATYDETKRLLQKVTGAHDGVPLHLASSLVSGAVANTICAPFDVIKSRVMSSDSLGVLGVIRQSIRNEGFSWMFRGWLPSFLRLGPNTIAVFVIWEQLKRLIDYQRATC